MYQKIMVPVDDSKTALRALEEACHVAQAVGASVYAVHVVDLAQFNWGTAEFGDSLALRRAVEEAIQIYPEAVIATPGGLVSDAATFNLLLAHCTTVWLQADPCLL